MDLMEVRALSLELELHGASVNFFFGKFENHVFFEISKNLKKNLDVVRDVFYRCV
jgi:hypothetical protein